MVKATIRVKKVTQHWARCVVYYNNADGTKGQRKTRHPIAEFKKFNIVPVPTLKLKAEIEVINSRIEIISLKQINNPLASK